MQHHIFSLEVFVIVVSVGIDVSKDISTIASS